MTNPAAAGPAGPAQPGEWVADLAASTVSFTVRNFGLRSVTGQVPSDRRAPDTKVPAKEGPK